MFRESNDLTVKFLDIIQVSLHCTITLLENMFMNSHSLHCIWLRQTVTEDELKHFPLGRRVPVNMQEQHHGFISIHGRL